MPTWKEPDDRHYNLVESHSFEHGKYSICIGEYKSNIDCTTNIKVKIKYDSIPDVKVVGQVEAVLIDRSCRFNFYNCCFQFSKSFARLAYDLFHPNGTLRSYKWTKLSDSKRYDANRGCVLYFRKVQIERNHRGHDLAFVVCKQIIQKMQDLFTVSVIKPEYKKAEHRYQRNLIRQMFSRLGFRPLEDGGNYPYKDYWYLLPDEIKFGRKDVACTWNLPVLISNDESLDNMLSNLQNYRDEKAIVKKIKSYLKHPNRNASMKKVFHHAAKQNMKRIVKCLVAAKQVDINCQDGYGNTVLHICSLSMYKHLLKYPDIDIHVKNKAGKLPYDVAVEMFNVTRCHDYMQSIQPDYTLYERFYFVLHELMPPEVYKVLLEGLLSPMMVNVISFSAGSALAITLLDDLEISDIEENKKMKICDVYEDMFYIEYFPKFLLNKVVTKGYLHGFSQVLTSIVHLLENQKVLPTRSRVLKFCKSSNAKDYTYFFEQGGKFENVLAFMINAAYGESIHYGSDEFISVEELEDEGKSSNLMKVPYFDEDLEYLRAVIFNYLCRN